MDLITIERILEAHPINREQLKQDYIGANNRLGKYVRLRFSYVYRSSAVQNELYKLGRTVVNPVGKSKSKPMGNIVTNAKGGESIHQSGLAFDIVLLIDKDKNGTFEEITYDMVKDFDLDTTPDWKEVTDYLLSKGYTNGFMKNGKKWDYPHFQKDFGYSWQELKAKIDKGDVIKDPNGIIYPKI